MGSFSVYCQLSNITITAGKEIVLLVLRKTPEEYKPQLLPIYGYYDDYGGVSRPRTSQQKLIEHHFNMPLQDFVNNLIEGKIENLDYTFFDKEVWDKVLKLDFERDNISVYHKLKIIGGNNIESDLEYNKRAKERSIELARLSGKEINDEISQSFRKKIFWQERSNYFKKNIEDYKKTNDVRMIEYCKKILSGINDTAWYLLEDLVLDVDNYTEDINALYKVRIMMYYGSYRLLPYTCCITPQDGEFEKHQELLDIFGEVNRLRISDDEY